MLKHTVKEVRLKSGAKGLLIDVPDASIMSVQINFRAGDLYIANDDKFETAHIMEHMSLGANKLYPSSMAFTAELEKNGAYSNASTGPTDMTYYTECADFEWDRVLKLLCIAISKPLFLDEEFTAEYGNVYEEMLGRSNSHSGTLAFEMSKKLGFRIKTYQERVQLMSNVKVEDIRRHYKETHFAENMRFVIAGKIKGRKTAIKKMLEAMTLPASKGQTRFEIPTETPKALTKPLFIENKTVQNAYFYIESYTEKELTRDEQNSMNILGALLTDTWGSKVFGKAREKGLIYYLSSGSYRSKGHSSWWFGSQISEKQIAPFLELFIHELRQVRKGIISDSDIDAAKSYLKGRHQMSAQSVGAIMNGYSGTYYYDETIDDYYTKFPIKIAKVSKKELIDMANQMFTDKIWGLGFLGTISSKAGKEAHKQLSSLWQ